jgi:hypothetical protein
MIHLLDPSEHSIVRVVQGRREALEYMFHVLGLVGVKILQLLQLAIRPSEPTEKLNVSTATGWITDDEMPYMPSA